MSIVRLLNSSHTRPKGFTNEERGKNLLVQNYM